MFRNYEIIKGKEPKNQPDHVGSFKEVYLETINSDGILSKDVYYYLLISREMNKMRKSLCNLIRSEDV